MLDAYLGSQRPLRDVCPDGAASGLAAASADESSAAPTSAWYPVALHPDRNLFRSNVKFLHGNKLYVGDRERFLTVTKSEQGKRFALQASYGLLWACPADLAGNALPLPELTADSTRHIIAVSMADATATFDHAVHGLVDPAHVPMVHNSWWWRSSRRERRLKKKRYEPSELGFTAHALDERLSSPVYRLVGAQPRVSIEFRLPGYRIERTQAGNASVTNLTVVVPQGPKRQRLLNVIYSSARWPTLLRPLQSMIGRSFLRQDARILNLTTPPEETGQAFLFIGDPDLPSLWYLKLRQEYRRSIQEGRPFINPIEPQTLSWRT